MPKLYKRKDSDYWWCYGHRPDGSRWSASTRQSSRREAEKAARIIERERLGEHEAPHPSVSLTQALDILFQHKVRKKCAVDTMVFYREKAKPLLRLFGGERDVLTISLADCEVYLDARRSERIRRGGRMVPPDDSTIGKELSVLKSALIQLRRHDLYPGDPGAIWPAELNRLYQPKERWLSLGEYQRLLAALPPGRRPYVTLYVYTGMRYSELYKARRDGDALVIRQTKGNRRTGEVTLRTVPLSSDARAVLTEKPLPWANWSLTNMSRDLGKACEKAGIERVTANDFRRTFASWLCQAGVAELTVIRLMGHHSSTMVRKVYGQLAPKTLEDAVAKLPSVRSERSKYVAGPSQI